MPLFRRIPKRGFNNKWRTEFLTINVDKLNRFEDGDVVTPESLAEAGFVSKSGRHIKILGNGKLERRLTVSAHKFSATAVEKIQSAGGTIKEITS
jgi:large subunit ribosomal protein L15